MDKYGSPKTLSRNPPWLPAHVLFWLIMGLASAAVIVLGAIGFARNLEATEPNSNYSWPSLLFLAIQLFTAESSVRPSPVGWELETARWLALLVAGATVVQGLIAIFGNRWNRFLLGRVRDHHIVCGYGSKGQTLVSDLVMEGDSVVLIAHQISAEELLELDERRVLVVLGDARHAEILKMASVERAQSVFVTCGDDASNVSITAGIMNYRQARCEPGRNALHLYTHIGDPQLFQMLRNVEQASETTRAVELKRFDTNHSGARMHLRQWPVDYQRITQESPLEPRLLYAGWSLDSEALLLQAARLCHLANGKKPQAHLIFAEATKTLSGLLFRYPQLESIIDVQVHDVEPDTIDGQKIIKSLVEKCNSLTTLYIARQGDGVTLATGMGLKNALLGINIPIFLQLEYTESIRAILERDTVLPILRVYEGKHWAGRVAVVRQQELDRLAYNLHANYLQLVHTQKTTAKPGEWIEKPAHKPWAELSEIYRADNRHSADHWEVKLRAIGCEMMEMEKANGKEPATLTSDEIEVLATMEHSRWNASKWLDGWKLGPRNDATKHHDNLVTYDELSEKIKDYDRDTVRKMPNELAKMGWLIVRK